MESSKILQKIFSFMALGFFVINIIVVPIFSNVENTNNKLVDYSSNIEKDVENKCVLTPEVILASYTTKSITANEEVISRSSRSRESRNNYISVDEITISKDMDLTQRCNISKDDFIELMSNVKYDTSNFFEENARTIYDLCEKYELNEIFFCGLISAESGWNIASNHRRTHNYISLMTSKGLIQFNSVEEGLEKAAIALHNNYLTETGKYYHGKTLEAVRTRFCPVNPGWTSLVFGRMQQIIK